MSGGGIIGSTTAYFLSHHSKFDERRDSITLLEATKIAGGASGKAGGLLALWAYPSCIVPLSYELHKEVCFVPFCKLQELVMGRDLYLKRVEMQY